MQPKVLHFPHGRLEGNLPVPASRSPLEPPGDDRRALEAEAPELWTVSLLSSLSKTVEGTLGMGASYLCPVDAKIPISWSGSQRSILFEDFA
jgi:hypothetical protein